MKSLRALRALCVFGGFALAAAALPAQAQHQNMPHMGMSGPADASASTQAFKAADERMMHDMSAPEYTGDADRDFVAHMIPHHQGAIEMAQAELKYGKDPEIKQLARNIIKAQHDEIAFMQRWLEKHGGK
ncbi:CopM family metallochaperone [Paraburkholderia sp. HP33-1]|uniref:CopM family metallochaperone n=1 Tax=Paraburkholderia sp. HP33-1 TaxID=2883243 RepID=UPI001F2072BD|nr:DUF305 domain-containing protein [Paraburkholderia sp. HP33-1]